MAEQTHPTDYFLYFDGGSRGNPGPSGSGSVIFREEIQGMLQEIWSDAFYVGDKETNNVAEYTGLLRGLKEVEQMQKTGNAQPIRRLTIRGDSLLIIKQMRCEYQVKAPGLIPLHNTCNEILQGLCKTMHVVFEHVPRKENKRADQLGNEAMDTSTRNTRNPQGSFV
jgi:probable phosphoglycerate mutase